MRHRELPVREIVRKYEAGASIRALAREYGTSKETIHRRLASSGVAFRPRHANVPRIHETARRHGDEIVRRYEGGDSLRVLARSYGITVDAVRRLLLSHGVRMRTTSQAIRLWHQHRRASP